MHDLRFPLGEFTIPTTVTVSERAAHIESIRCLPAHLRAAVDKLTDAQLAIPYRPDGWNARQVVHHLADSHMNSFIRMKLALTEEVPLIKAYEEGLWAELADSREAPLALSLSLLEALHARWHFLLASLTEGQWARAFRHPVLGVVSVDQAAALYAWHGAHHVAHITAMRAREGF